MKTGPGQGYSGWAETYSPAVTVATECKASRGQHVDQKVRHAWVGWSRGLTDLRQRVGLFRFDQVVRQRVLERPEPEGGNAKAPKHDSLYENDDGRFAPTAVGQRANA